MSRQQGSCHFCNCILVIEKLFDVSWNRLTFLALLLQDGLDILHSLLYRSDSRLLPLLFLQAMRLVEKVPLELRTGDGSTFYDVLRHIFLEVFLCSMCLWILNSHTPGVRMRWAYFRRDFLPWGYHKLQRLIPTQASHYLRIDVHIKLFPALHLESERATKAMLIEFVGF